MVGVNSSLDSCDACVDASCTWCSGSSFFGNPDVCVCGDHTTGFFGGCNDYSFGSGERNNKIDCAFGASWGYGVLALVIVGTIFVIGVCFACYNAKKRQETFAQRAHVGGFTYSAGAPRQTVAVVQSAVPVAGALPVVAPTAVLMTGGPLPVKNNGAVPVANAVYM